MRMFRPVGLGDFEGWLIMAIIGFAMFFPCDSAAENKKPKATVIKMSYTEQIGKDRQPPRTGGSLTGGVRDVDRQMDSDKSSQKIRSTLILRIIPQVRKTIFTYTKRQIEEIQPQIEQLLGEGLGEPGSSEYWDRAIRQLRREIGTMNDQLRTFKEIVAEQEAGMKYQEETREEYERLTQQITPEKIGEVGLHVALEEALKQLAPKVSHPYITIASIVGHGATLGDRIYMKYHLRKMFRENQRNNINNIKALCVWSMATIEVLNKENERLKKLEKLKSEWDLETEKILQRENAVFLNVASSVRIHPQHNKETAKLLMQDARELVSRLKRRIRLTSKQRKKLEKFGSTYILVSDQFVRENAMWTPNPTIKLKVTK